MGIKNGRKSYEQLQEQYEKFIIRHNLNEDGTARTTCLLVREGNVFVGVAKFSNRTFHYNKKKGRAIAQGRAEHAAAVFAGTTAKRVSQEKRREELSYIILSSEENTVDDIISNFFVNSES